MARKNPCWGSCACEGAWDPGEGSAAHSRGEGCGGAVDSDDGDSESPLEVHAYARAAPAAAPMSEPTIVLAVGLPSSDFWVCVVWVVWFITYVGDDTGCC